MGEGVSVTSTVGVGDTSSVGVGVRVSVGVGVKLSVGEGESVGVGLSVISVVGLGEAVGKLLGSGSELEFCGCGSSRTTKSFKLLSESKPFPKSMSAPDVIESAVESTTAFLSMLFPFAGLGAVVVSLSLVSPSPTLSTSVSELS